MRLGRNDPCPCGSGLKYKKCHIEKPINNFSQQSTIRTIRERNLIILSAIETIFLGKGKSWDEMKHSLTEDKVQEFYRVVAWLWKPNTDLASLLPKPSKTLRGLYTGSTSPFHILKNIVRYSLYTEEIIVVSPVLNPWTLAEKFNPIDNPKQFRQDTLEIIYFMKALAPWIYAGIVNVIPDPMDFDFELRKKIYTMAEERYQANKEEYDKDVKAYADEEVPEQLKRMYMRMPEEAFRNRYKRFKPDATPEEIEKVTTYLLKTRRDDPLLLDEEASQEAELKINRMGANLELGLYLGQITGSYLYTNNEMQWKDIMRVKQQLTDDAEVWSPLTRAFQQLDFNFLNDIDAKFAYQMQEKGRLGSFRNYLRRVWNKVEEDTTSDKANKAAREFSDELTEEYAIAKEDWAKIDKSLANFMTGAGATAMIAPVIAGGLNWVAPALGFAATGVGKLIEAHYKRKEFRANVPLAVLLDLEKKDKLIK